MNPYPEKAKGKGTGKTPTRAELAQAKGTTLPDVWGPTMKAVFCGINPSLYTAAVQCHFGRPGNRFWPALHASGFTPRLLHPAEQAELLTLGWGVTNLVAEATATANELSADDLRRGGALLAQKLNACTQPPRWLAVLGVTAFRTAFGQPRATLGPQDNPLPGTKIPVWILPNPSGLNAHYQLPDLARLFEEFRLRVNSPS